MRPLFVIGLLCHLIKMQPLLPSSEDLDETRLVSTIKAIVIRYEDSKMIYKYETLGESIQYITRNYLNNLSFLFLVFKPIYELPVPYNTMDPVKNINIVENTLSSVKTTKLIDQITMQVYEETQFKCILRRRLDT